MRPLPFSLRSGRGAVRLWTFPVGEKPVNVLCPGCGRSIVVEPQEMSLTLECARCGTRFVVRDHLEPAPLIPAPPIRQSPPSALAVLSAACPGCGRIIPLRSEEANWTIECAACDTRFVPATGLRFPPKPIQESRPSPPSFACPYCRTTSLPRIDHQVSQAGWVTFLVLFMGLCTLPVCWVPLLFMKDEIRRCVRCGMRLG